MSSSPPFNFAYIKTKPGILRTINLVVLFVAFAFSLASYVQSKYSDGCYLQPFCSTAGENRCRHIVDEMKRAEAYLEENKDSFSPEDKKALEYVSTQVPTTSISCPSVGMQLTGVVVIAFMWLQSLIVYILILRNCLDNEMCWLRICCVKSQITPMIWLLFGIIYLVGFICWAFAVTYPCTQEIYDELRSGKKLPAHYQALFLEDQRWTWEEWMANSAATSSNQPMMKPFPKKDCKAVIESTYQITLLSIGMTFSIIGFILLGVIWYIRKKEERNVAPSSPEEMEALGDEQEPVEVEVEDHSK